MKTAQMLYSNADSQIGEDLEQPGGRTHSDRDKTSLSIASGMSGKVLGLQSYSTSS